MSDPTAPSPLPSEPASGSTTPPPIAPATTPQPAPPATETTGLAPNIAAALASFFLLIGGIVFIVLEKKDQFVRFYAMQSIFLGGLSVALSIGLWITVTLLHGVPLVGWLLAGVDIILRLVIFVAWVVMVIKAFTNKEWEIPVLGKYAREQLAKMSSTTPSAPVA
jgi:uncharacterized membrane protein